MTYTTSTTTTSWYPVASGSTTAIDPYYVYSTSTLPVGTTLTIPKVDSSFYSAAPAKKEDKEYICNYCGTRYIDVKGGFIPNCKNCGAKLDKVEGE